jgi:hypothetical protein
VRGSEPGVDLPHVLRAKARNTATKIGCLI